MAGTNSLELEIHHLFQLGTSVDQVCLELLSKYEKNDALSSVEIEGLSHFLMTCGRYDLLKKLYERCLKKSLLGQFPVGFLTEIAHQLKIKFSIEDKCFIESLVSRQADEATALQSSELLKFSLIANRRLSEQPQKFNKERNHLKSKLIQQLNQNRIYQLSEQEEGVLNQLVKLFPNDMDVSLLKQAHLERKAEDILSQNNFTKISSARKASLFRAR